MKTSKTLLPTLDIGSHSNASAHLLPEAEATQERTLEAVSCTPVILIEAPSSAVPPWDCWRWVNTVNDRKRRRPQAI